MFQSIVNKLNVLLFYCFNPFSSSDLPIEDQRLIVSVPSALHSQKPSLSGTFKLTDSMSRH